MEIRKDFFTDFFVTGKIICVEPFNHLEKTFERHNVYDGFWCNHGMMSGMWGVICDSKLRLFVDKNRFISMVEWRELQINSILDGY